MCRKESRYLRWTHAALPRKPRRTGPHLRKSTSKHNVAPGQTEPACRMVRTRRCATKGPLPVLAAMFLRRLPAYGTGRHGGRRTGGLRRASLWCALRRCSSLPRSTTTGRRPAGLNGHQHAHQGDPPHDANVKPHRIPRPNGSIHEFAIPHSGAVFHRIDSTTAPASSCVIIPQSGPWGHMQT